MVNLSIPFSTKYKVKRLIDTITPISEQAESVRIELLEKYGKLVEGEGRYVFENDEDNTKFRQEYLDLLNNEEKLEIKKFTLDEFQNITNSSDFNMLFKLIED